jgi:ABC-type multidrug transport system fused ATPase/permease subunit
MLKLLVFTVIFLMVIPAGAMLARARSAWRIFFFVLMMFFMCWMQSIHIAPIPLWTGTARGIALTMVDITGLIVLLSMIGAPGFKVNFRPPGWWCYGLYVIFSLASGIGAEHTLQWSFEAAKMLWMYIIFLAAYNFICHYRELWIPVYTISGILIFMLIVGLYQKYLGGYYQIPSTMPHQNSLSLYVTLYGGLLLGVLLNEKTTPFQLALLGMGFLASALLLIFTYSRGGLACFLLAVAAVTVLSLLVNGVSGNRLLFILLAGLAMAVLMAIAAPRIINRFVNAPAASKQTRINLAKAAVRIANDHPIGVGLNNFSAYSGPFRKYAVEQHMDLKITDETKNTGGIVETIYLLVAAECGWVTMGLLLLWFFYYFFLGVSDILALRHLPCFGISAGIVGGLFSNYLQSTMEWSLKQYGNYYQLMLVFAMVAAIHATRKAKAGRK